MAEIHRFRRPTPPPRRRGLRRDVLVLLLFLAGAVVDFACTVVPAFSGMGMLIALPLMFGAYVALFDQTRD